ncbi:MAG: hypothetical protein M5U09_03065 [Gammaproteobacteria bacterium]|nr:hypothetical protein [Gammaproteobacteria bacterium]
MLGAELNLVGTHRVDRGGNVLDGLLDAGDADGDGVEAGHLGLRRHGGCGKDQREGGTRAAPLPAGAMGEVHDRPPGRREAGVRAVPG